jgi:hypothetical protein
MPAGGAGRELVEIQCRITGPAPRGLDRNPPRWRGVTGTYSQTREEISTEGDGKT